MKVTAGHVDEKRRQFEELPAETNGWAIVLEGRAKVINPYDKHELKTVGKLEAVGDHKYLLNKDFSYYGDVVAVGPHVVGSSQSL
mmetsp:Transcript_30342/g.22534  ORF Transcript_30342/g.22534 Transcript_30342/m.22534 type:complete len:85 (+) Transcript_30342:388-642(+)|eukprot:CAMPEP_0202969400 /NCGR_PEP_ID=MMETSP1396-20130829/15115_1 /ASSEMBLY_ACC=CAM_ASM_000872 /TAXON_ID= /ORGANISM="Pseudokeronopsis sp., Strain Brazil" /LENGTH=84 /DNA_ID=CAMNT_0049696887 /DNA_START=381 /DNA_END=635 /DNA_ORIENTATION=+